MKKTKKRFWLYKRSRTYYLWDTLTGKRENLRCPYSFSVRFLPALNPRSCFTPWDYFTATLLVAAVEATSKSSQPCASHFKSGVESKPTLGLRTRT